LSFLPPHTRPFLLIITTSSTCPRTAVSDQVKLSVGDSFELTKRVNMVITKPATQREHSPLKLQAHSIALKQPSCGDDHEQGLSMPAVAQSFCISQQNATLLHRINPWEAAAACTSWASGPLLCPQKSDLSLLWARLAWSDCSLPRFWCLAASVGPIERSKWHEGLALVHRVCITRALFCSHFRS
jgi:hypothetical protein